MEVKGTGCSDKVALVLYPEMREIMDLYEV